MSPSDEVLEKYRIAGRVAAEVRESMRRMVSEDMPIIEVCQKTESQIIEKGCRPAFPCNVSVNEIAAHYTSPPGDNHVVSAGSLVKVDIGVHVDGYIADTAVTVCLNPEYGELVRAAEDALEAGIKIIRAGLHTSRFGATIQKVIESHGLKPVANLTGHQINRYQVHAGSLPNVSHLSTSRVNEGEIYAIEPFVTLRSAAGAVKNGKDAYIFRYVKQKSLRNEYSRELCEYIIRNFRTLPFTERWLQGVVPSEHYKAAFLELLSSKTLMAYPIFIEASGQPVAQAEHTVFVTKDGCEVLT